MTRFYFHLRSGDELMLDEEGQNCSDISAALTEAVKSAREILSEAIKTGKDRVPEAFVIADEHGREIESVLLATAMPTMSGWKMDRRS